MKYDFIFTDYSEMSNKALLWWEFSNQMREDTPDKDLMISSNDKQ